MNTFIPDDAVEAALGEWACWPRRTELVTKMLNAAAPHMISGIRIDDDLWREFQAATATAGTNPSETIRQLVLEWLDKNKEEAEESWQALGN